MFKWLFGRKEGSSGEAAGGTPEIVVVTRRLKKPRGEVFATFVDRFGAWWPRERPLSGGAVGTIAIDARIGGKATETSAGGAQVWGTVLSFQSPEHIVIAWQIGPAGGLEASEATSSRVDVRFVAVDAETTDIVIVHRDFPRHGEGWQAYRAKMGAKDGWPQIMDAFARTVGG